MTAHWVCHRCERPVERIEGQWRHVGGGSRCRPGGYFFPLVSPRPRTSQPVNVATLVQLIYDDLMTKPESAA